MKQKMICAHEEIKTWYFEDTNQPAGMWSCKSCGHKFVPLKLWVGLTDEEVDEFCNGWLVDGFNDIQDFVEAITSELKEKNA